jgi:hypothetical protein
MELEYYVIEIRHNSKRITATTMSADAGEYQRGMMVKRLVASLPPYEQTDPPTPLIAREIYFSGDVGREVKAYEVDD